VMSRGLADPCGVRRKRSNAAAYGGALRAVGESAVYKRASVRAPLVFMPMTSAHRCGGHRPRLGALLEVADAGSSPRGEIRGVGRS
jgi:hypothetical protein